jgi:hypothetical protein
MPASAISDVRLLWLRTTLLGRLARELAVLSGLLQWLRQLDGASLAISSWRRKCLRLRRRVRMQQWWLQHWRMRLRLGRHEHAIKYVVGHVGHVVEHATRRTNRSWQRTMVDRTSWCRISEPCARLSDSGPGHVADAESGHAEPRRHESDADAATESDGGRDVSLVAEPAEHGACSPDQQRASPGWLAAADAGLGSRTISSKSQKD